MRIEARVVTIGDEILIGQIVDTNSAYIGALLNENGVKVKEVCSISDTMGHIVNTLGSSLDDCEITIVTGGLGPTKDDITKSAFCTLFNCSLKEDKPTTEFLKIFLEAKGVIFNELNRSQAMIPEVCEVLHNANGTAPGMMAMRGGHIMISLPGVPHEMKALMTDQVIPRIKSIFKLPSITHRTLFTYGLPESMLAERIEPWESSLSENLHLAYLPNPALGVRLRLSDYESPKDIAEGVISEKFAELHGFIGEHILGYDDATIEGAVADLLLSRGATLSVAESCTGGRISTRITALSGASNYYLGGVCSYANSVKSGVLGVESETLEQYGAVSEQVASQMAEGVRKLMGADYAIATTGVAGPLGGSDEKPVGLVWFAIATPEGVFTKKRQFGTLRAQNVEFASSFGLNMLREYLLKDKVTSK